MVVQQTPSRNSLFTLLNDANLLQVAATLVELHAEVYYTVGIYP